MFTQAPTYRPSAPPYQPLKLKGNFLWLGSLHCQLWNLLSVTAVLPLGPRLQQEPSARQPVSSIFGAGRAISLPLALPPAWVLMPQENYWGSPRGGQRARASSTSDPRRNFGPALLCALCLGTKAGIQGLPGSSAKARSGGGAQAS